MSEKFVVGQWVTCDVGVCLVKFVDTDETMLIETENREHIGWRGFNQCKPVVWQVGKTYKTTLDGVTATIKKRNEQSGCVEGTDSRYTIEIDWSWSEDTGLMRCCEANTTVPHLLPYLADEPQPSRSEQIRQDAAEALRSYGVDVPVADAATYDRQTRHGKLLALVDQWRAEDAGSGMETPADECDDVNHPPHYTQHPSGIECITITEAFNFNIGNAIKYLWRAGLKGGAVEDLRKAAWYVQREIERRTKR